MKRLILIPTLLLGMLLVINAGLARGEPSRDEAQTQAAPPGWVIRTVDSGNVGQYASLALDSNGYAHVGYYDAEHAQLLYAHQDSLFGFTVWLTRTVDTASGVGQYASLALDPDTDQPCIAYFDNVGKNLKLAWQIGPSTWNNATIATTGEVGYYPSLAFREGWAHVTYYDKTNGTLVYRKYDVAGPGFPSVTVVDHVATTTPYSSLKLRSSGNPSLSYYTGTSLNYAWSGDGGSTWYTATIDGGTQHMGRFNSMALDTFENGRISYLNDNTGDLKYAYWQFGLPGHWANQTVDSGVSSAKVGWYTSLALSDDGRIGISYYDSTNKDLKYAERVGGEWRITIVDQTDEVGWYTSLAFDAQGRPHIGYYDRTREALKYAYRNMTVFLPLVLRGD